jgi:predicted ATPase
VELCNRHGFVYYLAIGNIVTDWASAAEGRVDDGLTQFQQGLHSLRALGAELRLPYYFSLLTETLCVPTG